MFNSTLLKGALAGLLVIGQTAHAQDYQSFADMMTNEGSGFGWESFPVTSETGYNSVIFRITADGNGQALNETKGPVLFLHGMYSSPEDWIKRSDPATGSTPIQLAEAGYDVWLGCTRGRPPTTTHATLNLEDPDDQKSYWDYTFEQVGNEDVSTMVDKIIESRYESCTKVTLVTHSSAANSSLALATNESKNLSEKVSQIVTLAPCLQINFDEFWLPVRDLASIEAFYELIEEYGIYSMFGTDMESKIAAMCSAEGAPGMICKTYLEPVIGSDLYRQTSLMAFNHIQQNTAVSKFQQFMSSDPNPPLYNLAGINGINISAIVGDMDTSCPATSNLGLLGAIEGFASDTVATASHMDLISNNDVDFVSMLLSKLPELAAPIADPAMCPEAPPTPPEPENCLDVTDTKLMVLNNRIKRVEAQMERYSNSKRGDPVKIQAKLDHTLYALERFCLHHTAREEWKGWIDLQKGVEESGTIDRDAAKRRRRENGKGNMKKI